MTHGPDDLLRPTGTVRVSVTIDAALETVWSFLSDQTRLLEWMTYIPGAPIPPGSSFDPRPGGSLCILFPDGAQARGEVVEVRPRRRLAFTWGYDPDPARTGLGPGACRVEIELTPLGTATRVTLTHSGPMSDQLARAHEAGWRHYLSQLAANSAIGQFKPDLDRLLDTYFRAWNEHDDARRLSLLADCCDEHVRVRTAFACTDSREELSAHIANGLRHMPGVLLVSDGAPSLQHNFVCFRWALRRTDGETPFRGVNFARLLPSAPGPGGRIGELAGFQSL